MAYSSGGDRAFSDAARVSAPASSEEMKELGAQLARCLRPGDVVLLAGDLGAGKTRFVQGVAVGLGAAEVPTSPTFNIVVSYVTGRLPIHHFDLYRLEAEKELEDIGVAEYLESGGVCFVEWAEKFNGAFAGNLSVRIEKTGEHDRAVFARAEDARGVELLKSWACEVSLSEARSEKAEAFPQTNDEPLRQQGEGEVTDACAGGRDVRPSESLDVRAPGAGPVVVAFDTANEVVAIGVGLLEVATHCVRPLAAREIRARRASNTSLLPALDALLEEAKVPRSRIACVCVGRGPGSFTGVRIAMATAKGVASALGVPLVGVSSLDAVAWNAWSNGERGNALVIADAMRKEVYPAFFEIDEQGVSRLNADRVVKAEAFADEVEYARRTLMGDGLVKYLELFCDKGEIADENLWGVTGRGLLLALEAAWRNGTVDPFDAVAHDPAFVLPVYTRLSDAEESERARLATPTPRDLKSGVQAAGRMRRVAGERESMHASSELVAPAGVDGVAYHPLDVNHVDAVAAIERETMGAGAWNERMIFDELSQKERTWWVAESSGHIVGYAGGMIAGDVLEVLKVAVVPDFRRRGIARELVARVSDDARNLGAASCSLEVRASNSAARAFYESLGFSSIGARAHYYSDGEDAIIMEGALPSSSHDVAGMELQHIGNPSGSSRAEAPGGAERMYPLILAIESSCDETAAAVVDGAGNLRSDVVASQIDFHARFGGVVPEIASRKHVEAICGVCEEALAVASGPSRQTGWRDLDAIAATYAPGLVGALVVGVAFAKGAAWALDVPFIGVNHLEGHLYANKVGNAAFAPPAVVSLVSGGNTMLVHMRDWGDYVVLGSTIDDAVGEAFDKVSKALGLGYPGGPVISEQAKRGNPEAIDFPRAMLHSHDFRFSLSGLKTAVVNHINNERQAGREPDVADIAASFQQAVVDVQVAKAKSALEQTGARTFCLGGGVAANPVLRSAYEQLCEQMGVELVMPPLSSCGDNAGMIALVALDRYAQGKFFDLSADAYAHANLDEPY